LPRLHNAEKSAGAKAVKHVRIQADSGCQGINKYHANRETPKKKSEKLPLRKEGKINNRRIGSKFVIIALQ
jgi:hypothetical protein